MSDSIDSDDEIIDYDEKTFELYLLNNNFPEEEPEDFFSSLSLEIRSNIRLVRLSMLKLDWRCYTHASKDIRNNKDIVIFGMHLDVNFFTLIPESLRSDVEFIFYLLKFFPIYEFLSPELQYNADFLVAACRVQQEFSQLPEKFVGDKLVIQNCLQYSASVLEYISDELKNDFDIGKACIRLDPLLLFQLGMKCQMNKDLCAFACERNGCVLEHLDEKLKSEKEIVFAAVGQFGPCLKFCSNEWQDDRDLVLLSLRNHSNALEYVSERLRKDPDVAKLAIENDLFGASEDSFVAMAYLPEYQNDKEFVMDSIRQNAKSFIYCSKELKDDEDCVKLALSCEGSMFLYVSDEMRSREDIAKLAFETCGLALEHVSEKLLENRDLVKIALEQNGLALKYVPKFHNDLEMCTIAVKSNPESIVFVDVDLVDSILQIALKEDGNVIEKVDEKYKIKDNLLLSLENGGSLENVSEKYHGEREFYLACAKSNPTEFSYLENDIVFADKEIINYAIRKNPAILKKLKGDVMYQKSIIYDSLELNSSLAYIPFEMQMDEKILDKALKNPANLVWVSESNRKDPSYVLDLIKKNKSDEYLMHVNYELLSDSSFAKAAISIISSSYQYFGKKVMESTDIIYKTLSACGSMLSYVPQKSQNDDDFQSIAFRNDPSCLLGVSHNIQMQCVRFSQKSLVDCQEFEDNREILINLIKLNPSLYTLASPNLKRDSELVTLTLDGNVDSLDSNILPYLSKDQVISCLKRKLGGVHLNLIKASLLKDRDTITTVLYSDADLLEYTDILRYFKQDPLLKTALSLVCNTQTINRKHIRTSDRHGILGRSDYSYIPSSNFNQ